MKWLVAGNDSSGASCVLESGELELTGELNAAVIIRTGGLTIPALSSLKGNTQEIAPPPGDARWTLVAFPPNDQHELHNTPSLDFDVILQGSMFLTLGDGEHALEAGDCVAVTGVDHAWRIGPDGAIMAVLMVGSDNRS